MLALHHKRVADGVIAPAKVVRTALQDAASVSDLLITTEAASVEAPKKDAAPPWAAAAWAVWIFNLAGQHQPENGKSGSQDPLFLFTL